MLLTALGINIFGGGFTLGVKQSKKFEIMGQWEECRAGARTFDLNFKGIHRPLNYYDWPWLDISRPNLVYANPPCAPWSTGNTVKGRNLEQRLNDPRLAMTKRTMETALTLEPDVFALESVARAYSQGRAYYDEWAEKWIAKGYGVTYYLTDALLLGIPSVRERFHFIAHKYALGICEPNLKIFMPKTVGQAIGDLMGKYHEPDHMPKRWPAEVHAAMAKCEPTQQLNEVDDCVSKWSFLYRKPLWDAPAYTVINLEMQLHPKLPRLLTVREGLRLCGYPDDFVRHPNEMAAATQAVMPGVGKHIADLAHKSIIELGYVEKDLVIVDHRDLAKPYRPAAVWASLQEEL